MYRRSGSSEELSQAEPPKMQSTMSASKALMFACLSLLATWDPSPRYGFSQHALSCMCLQDVLLNSPKNFFRGRGWVWGGEWTGVGSHFILLGVPSCPLTLYNKRRTCSTVRWRYYNRNSMLFFLQKVTKRRPVLFYHFNFCLRKTLTSVPFQKSRKSICVVTEVLQPSVTQLWKLFIHTFAHSSVLCFLLSTSHLR